MGRGLYIATSPCTCGWHVYMNFPPTHIFAGGIFCPLYVTFLVSQIFILGSNETGSASAWYSQSHIGNRVNRNRYNIPSTRLLRDNMYFICFMNTYFNSVSQWSWPLVVGNLWSCPSWFSISEHLAITFNHLSSCPTSDLWFLLLFIHSFSPQL